jgi:UDP-glucose 4-epimerase
VGPRRDGDPPALVASSDKLREKLGWSPKYGDLREIVAHAWAFANR